MTFRVVIATALHLLFSYKSTLVMFYSKYIYNESNLIFANLPTFKTSGSHSNVAQFQRKTSDLVTAVFSKPLKKSVHAYSTSLAVLLALINNFPFPRDHLRVQNSAGLINSLILYWNNGKPQRVKSWCCTQQPRTCSLSNTKVQCIIYKHADLRPMRRTCFHPFLIFFISKAIRSHY